MLGWEFPPVMAGGLGTACYGLTKALSKYVDLTMVLPKTEATLALEDIRFIGLNFAGLTPETQIEFPEVPYEQFAHVEYVDTELSPYPLGFTYFNQDVPLNDLEQVRALYSTNEPYGSNIMEKVAVYAEVVSRIAQNLEFDIIHAHDWITYPAALRIKKETGKPLTMHIHSLETDRIGTQAKHQVNAVYNIEKSGMEAADMLMPVSYFTKGCAVEHYGIDANKFYPVYNAIDPIPTYRTEKPTEEDKIVLFLGRVTFQKGPEYMAETAFKLVQRYPNVKFYVAGVGDQLQKLKDLTTTMGIFDRFVFAGFLKKPQVQDILSKADAYFMPSVSEPFGLSALEAAQFGIPCVLSRQSGVSEVMNNALIADYWDTEGFANCLYSVLNYEGLAKEMVEKTNEELTQISWDNTAAKVYDLYQILTR